VLKLLFLTGIVGIAVVSGTLQALACPRKIAGKETEMNREKAKWPQSSA
jgi:hypothetical protein